MLISSAVLIVHHWLMDEMRSKVSAGEREREREIKKNREKKRVGKRDRAELYDK